MRAVVVVALLGVRAHAEPQASVRDGVERDGVEPEVTATLRMRPEGASAGIGAAVRWTHGDYALSLGLTRWQTIPIDKEASQGTWELAVRGYRFFQVGARTQAFLTAGAALESVERDARAYGRTTVGIGAGLSTKLADGMVGWMRLSLEHRHWLANPTGGADDELAVMLMFGFDF